MALVRGEDSESDSEEVTKNLSKHGSDKTSVTGKLVEGEEPETDDEDSFHDPEVSRSEADIRIKGDSTNEITGGAERVPIPSDILQLPESATQKKLGENNRRLRKSITQLVLSTYYSAIGRADKVAEELAKSQQISAKCMDDMKQTATHLDHLSNLLSSDLNTLPEIKIAIIPNN